MIVSQEYTKSKLKVKNEKLKVEESNYRSLTFHFEF